MSYTLRAIAIALVLIVPAAVRAQTFITTDTTQNGATFVVDPPDSLAVSDPANNPLFTLTNGASTSGIQDLYVGYGDAEEGRVLVDKGSVLSNDFNSVLGQGSASTGMVTVTDPGSKWQNDDLYVGNSGTGTLNIENGGVVTSHYSYLGTLDGSTGTATVTGEGSKWQTDESLYVGYRGAGTMTIENAGVVSNNYGYLGSDYGLTGTAEGTVTVTGPGSKWQNDNYVYVGFGFGSTGTMTVANGGVVTSYAGALGLSDGSTGTVTVTGPDSKWENNGVTVGSDADPNTPLGTGTLTVENGGTVDVGDGSVDVGLAGTLAGDGGTIIGDVVNKGLISPGNSPGVLTIDGDLTNSGHVKFELAGTTSGLFDQLLVSGEVDLGGVVDIDLLDGFGPTAGSSFKLLTFSSFTDSGYTFDFTHATLAEDLTWDVSTFAVDGTIRVVPEASSLVLAGIASLAGLAVWRKKC